MDLLRDRGYDLEDLGAQRGQWSRPAPGKVTRSERLPATAPAAASAGASAPVQADRGAMVQDDPFALHLAAQRGVSGAATALPHAEAIQASFGRHDVSGVRAHVGGPAASASAEIGAAAYATGDSVAFAAPPDLRQAAHEAAHVVQQRGGVHLDGGVGRAGDPYERHADAVAALVVSGESAEALLDTMAGGGGGRAAVQRLDAEELEGVAAVGEDMARADMAADGARASGPRDRVAAMSNIGDIAAANAEIGRIQGARSDLATAVETRLAMDFEPQHLVDNDHAVDALREYVFQAEGQSDSIGTFQAQCEQLRIDYARLSAEMETFRGAGPGGATRGLDGADLGTATVAAVGARPTAPARGDADLNQLRNDAAAANGAMMTLSRQVPTEWSAVMTSREAVREGVQWLASGLEPRAETAAQAAHRQLREHVAAVAGVVSSIVSVAQRIAGAHLGDHVAGAATAVVAGLTRAPHGEAEDMAGDVLGRGSNLVTEWTTAVVEFAFEPALARAEAAALSSVDAASTAQVTARCAAIRQAKLGLDEHVRTYLRLVTDYESSKRAYRDAVRNAAGPMDHSGGEREAVLGEFTAESGAFLAQARTTEDLGRSALTQADEVATTRRGLHHGDGGPVQWHEAVLVPHVATSGAAWERRTHTVDIAHADGRLVERGTADESNPTLRAAVSEIGRMRTSIEGFHGAVATPLGLSSRTRT